MSAHVDAIQTADGWLVIVEDVEQATIETSGSDISIKMSPDNDGHSKPLDVTLN